MSGVHDDGCFSDCDRGKVGRQYQCMASSYWQTLCILFNSFVCVLMFDKEF